MTDYVKAMRKYIGHETLMLVGSGVIIHKGGKLLLQKRADNGCWADHGGGVELGETLEETAGRELFEETGLRANRLELIGVFSGPKMFYTYPNGDKVYIVAAGFLCEDYSGEISPDSGEVAELAWFSLDALPENISPPSKLFVDETVKLLKNRK